MMTWTFQCSERETAAQLARTLAELVRGAQVRWEGLPGWVTRFHVTCKTAPCGALVGLLLWPEPDAE